MAFNIGDRIKTKAYEDLPEELRNNGIAKMTKKFGTIEDRMYSESADKFFYVIKFDGFKTTSHKMWSEDYLEAYSVNVTYHYEFDYLDNVVVARFYEIRDGVKTEIGRGHGHIIHEGAVGISQAASYALKKIFENLNGGSLI